MTCISEKKFTIRYFVCQWPLDHIDLTPLRFVPYIGIVTILMNDYPKFKVSSWNPLHFLLLKLIFFVYHPCSVWGFFNCRTFYISCVSVRQYAVLFMLGLFVLVHREWGIRPSGLKKNELCPGNLTHAFSNWIQLDFVKPNRLFVRNLFGHFVEMWIECLHLKNLSFKIFLWGN